MTTSTISATGSRLAVTALGLTQIIGYGTLYYSFSALADSMAKDVGWSSEWVFAAFSISLLAGALPRRSQEAGSTSMEPDG